MKTNNKRGAILITAIVLATGVAIALGSFVTLSVRTARLSNSSFYSNSALNLAEAALEEAMVATNTDDWSGWTAFQGNSANLTKQLPTFDVGDGVTGIAQVVVFGARTSDTPRMVAQGRTVGNLGASVTKQIEVRLRRRSIFPETPIGKDLVTFAGGNATIDSYDSEDNLYSTGGLYDPAKRKDGGSIASLRVIPTTDGISLGNAKIWGYAATAGADVDVGPNGEVRGSSTPTGVKVDTSRIRKDYPHRDLPVREAPTSGFSAIYGNVNSTTTFGTAGASSLVFAANLTSNNSSDIFTIEGDVTMVVSGDVTIKGAMNIAPGGSLKLYVAGDMDVGGNGIVNGSNLPKNLMIFGTDPVEGGQTIKLHGNGVLVAAVDAPHAHIELKGGGSDGEMWGTFVGYDVKITGNYAFHYDEALGRLNDGEPFTIGAWTELVSHASWVAF